MKEDSFIRRLQSLADRSAPHVSLYLNTQAQRQLGPQEMKAQWRQLRDQVSDSAPDKALSLLDDAVEGAHREGQGLIAITSGEELSFRRSVDSTIPNSITAGALPHLLPLLDHRQNHPSYGIVLIDRTGAEIHIVDEMLDDEVVEVEGDHDVIRKVQPGGMSQRRYQNRAEDSWERNSEKVAENLTKIVRTEGLDLVIVMGDVRAKALLHENASPEVQPILHALDTAPPTNDRLEEVREEVEAAVAALVARRIDQTLEKFLEERGQSDLAADGLDATFAALRMSQVETLLITDQGVEGEAWFVRNDATQGATERSTLQEIGADDIEAGRTDDVLIRMALGTGAAITVVPDMSADRGPTGGVGAILRFSSDTATTTRA